MRRWCGTAGVLAILVACSADAGAGEPLAHALPGMPWTAGNGTPIPAAPDAPAATKAGPQSGVSGARPLRPTGRVSVHTNSWRLTGDGQPASTLNEIVTTVSYELADRDDDGVEFGVDLRHSGSTGGRRQARLSIYDGFVGLRLRDGAMRVRGGHLWLNELGGLGAVAGALLDLGQRPETATRIGQVRAGVFGGLEPRLYEAGYESRVRKYGGYVTVQGADARRHVVGVVRVENGPVMERSVLVTTNSVPLGRRLFVYQAAEFDLEPPAGRAEGGWTYFFANVRAAPAPRVDLQATVSRGRSLDVRGLSQDVLAGRPVAERSLEGLRYQSAGGRATVEVFQGARVYGGYTRDTDNYGDAASHRWLAGAYLMNVAGTGFDVTASDTLTDRPAGRSHARYVSVGRQIGRRVYVSSDYSSALAVVRFLRGDGLLIEMRPETRRIGSSAIVSVGRTLSVLTTVDYTRDASFDDVRVTAGLTYRIR